MNKRINIISQSRGITMIENLVALLVISIGLLGLAGLQASTLRNATDATYRSTAVQQAADMVNRITVNTAGAVAGSYNAILPTPPAPATFCDAATCTGPQLAVFDAWEWNTANVNMLPSGGGTVVGAPIAIPSPNPSLAPILFTVTVRWDGNRSGATGLGCDPSNTSDLKCVTLQVVAP